MIKVSEWAACSGEVWQRWFRERADGPDGFAEVEEALLRALVLRPLGLNTAGVSSADFFQMLRVRYPGDLEVDRQVCVTQKAGNVWCRPGRVTLRGDTDYQVRGVDPTGTMKDSEPYAEVVIGEAFILEPLGFVRFFVHG